MTGSSQEVECELIDLSSVALAELRQTDLTEAEVRVSLRLRAAGGSISGYSGKFAEPDRTEPDKGESDITEPAGTEPEESTTSSPVAAS
jgi:hypothetical protein